MTNTELKRKEAREIFNYLQTNLKFTKNSIEKSLKETNTILCSELKYSKDLRNIDYLQSYFLVRQYYKTLISLF